jgi:hypothetical protein
MISAVSIEPAVPAASASTRVAPVQTQRAMTPEAAPPVGEADVAGGKPAADQPEATVASIERDASTIFAAAVIVGALSPTPETVEEVIRRIGTSTVPAEMEARLKDLRA